MALMMVLKGRRGVGSIGEERSRVSVGWSFARAKVLGVLVDSGRIRRVMSFPRVSVSNQVWSRRG